MNATTQPNTTCPDVSGTNTSSPVSSRRLIHSKTCLYHKQENRIPTQTKTRRNQIRPCRHRKPRRLRYKKTTTSATVVGVAPIFLRLFTSRALPHPEAWPGFEKQFTGKPHEPPPWPIGLRRKNQWQKPRGYRGRSFVNPFGAPN